MEGQKYKYLFGPVSSRRLGSSLGVDIVPLKTCTQNCIYCQLGKDAQQVIQRKEHVPIEAVLDELKHRLDEGPEADYITISGSGEPTLNSGLGRVIDGVHRLTTIPVAVITNGTLLSEPDVRAACCKADVVLPSLDAGDAETFEKMNHPHPDLDFHTFVQGLIDFRTEYKGPIWLEVFFCERVNTEISSISNLKTLIEQIRPDKIHLNTSVRPVVHPEAVCVQEERLKQFARILGPKAEAIVDFSKHTDRARHQATPKIILETLRRRPCSLEDLSHGLGLPKESLQAILNKLESSSKIICTNKGQKKFYQTP